MVEFLERLGVDYQCELWLVRADGVLRTAHVFVGDDRDWVRQIEEETRPWLGFSHPRIAEVCSVSWTNEPGNLVIVVGDERGLPFLHAARRLEDPREREPWAVAQIIALGDALGAMVFRSPGLVHRRVYDHAMVRADGHAQLRAPIAWVQAFKHHNYVGRGNSIGSPYGLAPEQARGVRVTPATDVFQLAVLLYTAIAGKRPFTGDNDFEILHALVEAKPPAPPSSSLAVWTVLRRGLDGDPANRYPTPAAFADALRHAGDAEAPPSALAKLAAFEPGMRPPPSQSAAIVGQRCTKRWDALTPTGSDGVRHCSECKHDVIEVRSLQAIIPLLGKRCIAYRPE